MAVTSLLKMFFRNLDTPLFPYDLYQDFLTASRNNQKIPNGILEN